MTDSARDRALLKAVAETIRDYTRKAFDALAEKVSRIESDLVALQGYVETIPEPLKGEDGKSVTAEDVLPELKAEVSRLVAEIPKPQDGKSVTAEDVLPALTDLVKQLDAARPVPRDGIDGKNGDSVTLDDIRPLIDSQADRIALDLERRSHDIIQRAIDRIPTPKDGISPDPEDVAAKVIERLDLKGTRTDLRKLCAELVEAEVAKMGKPQDGKSVELAEVLPVVKDQVAEFLAGLKPPQDGKSVSPEDIKAILDERAASWELDFEKRAQQALEKAIDRMPKPQDGKDGLGFADWRVELMPDGRTLRHYAERDGKSVEHFIRLPIVLDQGVFKEETDYVQGDAVTWGGSLWIAQKDAPQGKPGQYNRDWRLAVKRGQSGKP